MDEALKTCNVLSCGAKFEQNIKRYKRSTLSLRPPLPLSDRPFYESCLHEEKKQAGKEMRAGGDAGRGKWMMEGKELRSSWRDCSFVLLH